MPADIFRSICLLLSILICFACGCEPSSKKQGNQTESIGGPASAEPTHAGDSNRSNLDAKAILTAVLKRYRNATSYQDKGVLYLSYMLNGQRLDEPKRWATSYTRDGKLALETFNTKIRGDGKIMACEIFDIETGNLDNQNLVVPYTNTSEGRPQPPLQQLAQDRIARHFVFGFSEVPLEPSYETDGPWLLPPPASLLTRQVPNPWLQDPEQIERRPDQVVENKTCFVVRSLARQLTADIWIDQQSLTIVQMSLPLKLLADEVITSDEVSEVLLVAKFHNAKFDTQVTPETFNYSPRNESVFVRKLVSLPEPLPCEKIGFSAPPFSFTTPTGQPIASKSFDGKTTVLVWLSGLSSIQTALKLKPIFTAADQNVNFGIAYSDSDTQQPGSGRPDPSPAINDLVQALQVPVYYDRQHTASSKLGIKSVPAALVLDDKAKVQYVQTLAGENWKEKLTAAIDRVNNDEDLAGEMRDAYAQYLDTYHQQILSVSADSIVGRRSANQTKTSDGKSNQAGRLEISPKRVWLNTDFKQAGNIVAIQATTPASTRFAIYDGVQSIGLVDSAGKRLQTTRPSSISKNESITKFRLSPSNGAPRLIAFSAMGSNFFTLDERLQEISSLQNGPTPDPQRRIVDVQWHGSGNQDTHILVAFENDGVHRFPVAQQNGTQLSRTSFKSLASVGYLTVGVSKGKLVEVDSGRSLSNSEINFTRVVAGGEQFVGIGQNVHGKWSAFGFDKSFERLWAIETGPHLHENFLSSISSSTTQQGELIWAIADSNQMIHLVTGGGQWLGEFQSEHEINGLCVANVDGKMQLLICSPRGVECWNLNVTKQ